MPHFTPTVEVRLEGESEILFSILALGHQLREGDVFTFDGVGSGPVDYRVESAKLVIRRVTNPESSPATGHYTNPVLLIEASEVP